MMKRKITPDVSVTIKLTAETEAFLQNISDRSGLSIGDIIILSWGNGFERNTVYPKVCGTCGRENWRDEVGVVFKLYEMDVDACVYCGSDGDGF